MLAEDPLAQQFHELVSDSVLLPGIDQLRGQMFEQAQAMIGLAQQEQTGVGRDAVVRCIHLDGAVKIGLEQPALCFTHCVISRRCVDALTTPTKPRESRVGFMLALLLVNKTGLKLDNPKLFFGSYLCFHREAQVCLEELIERLRIAIARNEPYIFLPEMVESLQRMKEDGAASYDRKRHMARWLGRLITEDYAFSESKRGVDLLRFVNRYVSEESSPDDSY